MKIEHGDSKCFFFWIERLSMATQNDLFGWKD